MAKIVMPILACVIGSLAACAGPAPRPQQAHSALRPPTAASKTVAAASQMPVDYSCTGPVHTQAIDLWEKIARPYLTQQLQEGLNIQGDVYVLYYIQERLQSFVEMTRRCKDTQQIDELATMLNLSFASLNPLPDDPKTYGWICTGGSTCTPVNRLLGKEVQLCSVQFLGLLGAVATTIIETIPVSRRTPAEKAFVADASNAMAVQLNHWLTPAYFRTVATRASMSPADVTDAGTQYYFLDTDLWKMTILSDLAELNQADTKMHEDGQLAYQQLQAKHDDIVGIFNLFLKRVTNSVSAIGVQASIDKGYWKNFSDFKFARYTGTTSPVLCQKNASGIMQKIWRVDSRGEYIDPDMGWDISHARRLVPALSTFSRNWQSMGKAFGYHNDRFTPAALQVAFANQLEAVIWNHDQNNPLFSNFWDGRNGWYRAGYENGTGECRPGQPPYSLTGSFPTGGYVQWGIKNKTIRMLGERIYQLIDDKDTAAKEFMVQYYPELGNSSRSPTTVQQIWRMDLIADLIPAPSSAQN
ncbi:MAG: hypothetical protein JSR26_02090 [Proteobacteria bacterium]|nr:hypothetical protein [Pseudomonadota bacterium]